MAIEVMRNNESRRLMAHPPSPVIDDAPGELPGISITVPARLAGLALAIAVALALAALASWSVDDPSLSFATDRAPSNWLGAAGAVFADLGFQLLGLAAFLIVLPPAAWAIALMRRQRVNHIGWRLLSFALALAFGAGLLSCVPVPQTWPLPTGLGGLVGSGFSGLALWLTGEVPAGAAAVLYGLVLGPLTVTALILATGLMWRGTAPGPVSAEDGPDRPSLLDIVLGGFVHAVFAFRTALRRAWNRHQTEAEAADAAWRDARLTAPASERREPTLARSAPDSAPRIEPRFQADTGDYVDFNDISATAEPGDPPAAPPPAADDASARLSVERGPGLPQGQQPAAPRISAPAARPRPGTRQTREAQGSLLDSEGFDLPELGLLAEPRHIGLAAEHRPEKLEENARRLEGVLEDFGVKGDIINVRPGPVVTLYELEPAPGIKSSRVISLADDIARSMSAISARVAVVPGRNAIGIELPNASRETVYLREMLASADFEKMKGKLNICLGKTIGGEPIIADLARMPHLLVAGTTGSGKSVAINTMILSLLYRMTPEQCRLIMIDPKMLELSIYDGIPHLLTPVVTDPSKAVVALKWAVREMEDRYRKMSKIGVRNIDGFNQRVAEARKKGKTIKRTVQTGFDKDTGEAIYESEEFDLEPLPFIVIIVDEMADLMMVAGKDIEGAIQRLAQMARAAGIHLVMATQRPSVDVITGTIKANFPTRISFQVTSKIDSRTILGEQGAEQLLGMGDMLYMAGGGRIRRLHGPFVSDGEVEDVVAHLKSQGSPDYLEAITAEDEEDGDGLGGDEFGGSGDELYDKAVNVVLNDGKASTSYIQRRLSIGYNRAATLIEKMEKEGVISPANHAGKREILVGDNAAGY